jgi:putative methionine-R-sulfoxide reductase with GAF domain
MLRESRAQPLVVVNAGARGNASRTGVTLLVLSGVTGVVGVVLLALQHNGYVKSDPFIGSTGLIIISFVNGLCGLSMTRQHKL